MTDIELRRHARTSMDPAQELGFLHTSLRSGLIAASHVELLVSLEDEWILEALGPASPWQELAIPEWIGSLSRWGRTACARAVLALARARPRLDRRQWRAEGHRHEGCHREWIARLDAWVACPCASHAQREVRRTDGELCTFPSLLKVRGRKRIGREAERVAHRLLYTQRRRSYHDPQLRTRICRELLPWARGLALGG